MEGKRAAKSGRARAYMWYVYMLKCSNGALYTGMTNDIEKRIKKHNTGQGSAYTRSHLPVFLVYSEKRKTRSAALKREAEIKRYSRKGKMELISEKR